MVFLSAATFVGYGFGAELEGLAPKSLWPMIQACVAGGLCHVLLHQNEREEDHWRIQDQWVGAIGVVVGAAVLYENGIASLVALLIAGPLMSLCISKWHTLKDPKTYIAFSFGAAAIGFGIDETLHYDGVHDHLPIIFSIPVMIGMGLLYTRLATMKINLTV